MVNIPPLSVKASVAKLKVPKSVPLNTGGVVPCVLYVVVVETPDFTVVRLTLLLVAVEVAWASTVWVELSPTNKANSGIRELKKFRCRNSL